MRKSPPYTHFLPIKWTVSIQIRLQKYFSPIMAKRSQSSSVSIWSAGHQFQSDRQQFSLQVKLTKYKWKVTGDTKAPTEMDASCGKIIATTKKVIRVTAYMHIRVGKLDVPMSSFQNLVRTKLETQWNESWKLPRAIPKQDWKNTYNGKVIKLTRPWSAILLWSTYIGSYKTQYVW